MLIAFRNERKEAAVVFIHGFAGDPKHSWGQFPEFLTCDVLNQRWQALLCGGLVSPYFVSAFNTTVPRSSLEISR